MRAELNMFEAAMIKLQLKRIKNSMVVVPDKKTALELHLVHGIPPERIGLLQALRGTGKILIMSERQYNYYLRKERDLVDKKE